MKKYCVQWIIAIALIAQSNCFAGASFQQDVRVLPLPNSIGVILRVRNITKDSIIVADTLMGSNVFRCIDLSNSQRRLEHLSLAAAPNHATYNIMPDSQVHFGIEVDEIFQPFLVSGIYTLLSWRFYDVESSYFCVGIEDEMGNINPPIPKADSDSAEIYLGLIHRIENEPDMCFLFLNGSNETVTVAKPLTEASRIVATSPAIDYTRELFLADQEPEIIEIESGEVGEWRIPWPTIRGLISEADLAAIKEAGGDLDLVWKVGDFQSEPLPISVAELRSVRKLIQQRRVDTQK